MSFLELIDLYDIGNYSLASDLIKKNTEDLFIYYKQLYLLAMCDYTNINNDHEALLPNTNMVVNLNESDLHSNNSFNSINNNIHIFPMVNNLKSAYLNKKNETIGRIIYALYHLQSNPINRLRFPVEFNDLFDNELQQINKGIKILEDTLKLNDNDNIHIFYILAKYYLNFESEIKKDKGHSFLIKSARSGHFLAKKELDIVGVNWKDIDQFGDHCETWLCIPDFKPNKIIKSCIGCGKTDDGSGWTECNCCILGYKTELSTNEISKYCVSGFLNTLKSLEHIIKLLNCLCAIMAIGFQNLDEDKVYIAQYLTIIFSTLVLFIKQELNNKE